MSPRRQSLWTFCHVFSHFYHDASVTAEQPLQVAICVIYEEANILFSGSSSPHHALRAFSPLSPHRARASSVAPTALLLAALACLASLCAYYKHASRARLAAAAALALLAASLWARSVVEERVVVFREHGVQLEARRRGCAPRRVAPRSGLVRETTWPASPRWPARAGARWPGGSDDRRRALPRWFTERRFIDLDAIQAAVIIEVSATIDHHVSTDGTEASGRFASLTRLVPPTLAGCDGRDRVRGLCHRGGRRGGPVRRVPPDEAKGPLPGAERTQPSRETNPPLPYAVTGRSDRRRTERGSCHPSAPVAERPLQTVDCAGRGV